MSCSFLSYSWSDVTGLNSTVLSPDLLTGNITVTGTGLVPESSTLMLLSLGVLGMLAAKYRHYRFKDVVLCCDNRALIGYQFKTGLFSLIVRF